MSSTSNIDELCINTIRCLAADTVQKSNSGHPGMPMGMAPVGHLLFSQIMNFNSSNSTWWNRDRFLLSNGHGCALQYILLHLSGYKLSLDDLKQFRQVDSKTPGHPEVHYTDGVEVTTGPLGQGVANGVGLAWAESQLAATYNKPGFELFNNYTYVFAGDGCMQEGVASEASSLAGHWKLNKLILIYDDNGIQIDGHTNLAFSENVEDRYKSYGWNTIRVGNGDTDYSSITTALKQAHKSDRPTLILLKTTIGFGSPNRAGTHKAHGEALGADEVKKVKQKLGFDENQSFVVPESVYKFYSEVAEKGKRKNNEWNELLNQYKEKFPKEYDELHARFNQTNFSVDLLKSKLPQWKSTDKPDATRNTSGIVLNAVAELLPQIVGGSADLAPSNKTEIKVSGDYSSEKRSNRYIRFGVREFGMCAIANGIYAYGGFIPYTATFLNFIEYAFPAVRLTAISQFKQILIMTHDSIGLGEDGPTHQPIEALALCRATPNILVLRPADGNETTGSYIQALQHNGPSVLSLTRQNLPQLAGSSVDAVAKGGYTVFQTQPEAKEFDLIFVASGSEVSLCIDAAKILQTKHNLPSIRVVSLVSAELFDRQPVEYRRTVLIPGCLTISVETASIFGWAKYSHYSIGMRSFGASGPLDAVMSKFGFTAEKVAQNTKTHVESRTKELKAMGIEHSGKYPTLQTHFQD